MEDVLEVYQRPHDPQASAVCLDETSKQLIVEALRRSPRSQDARRVMITKTNATASPICSWCSCRWKAADVKVTDRHTAIDYAYTLRDSSEVHFPNAVKIVRGQDNLDTRERSLAR